MQVHGPTLQVWYCTRLPGIIRTSLADTQIQKATFIWLKNESDQQTNQNALYGYLQTPGIYVGGISFLGGGRIPPPPDMSR